MPIEISVKLFATLVKYLPEEADRFPMPEGATVGDLVKRLAIPEKEAKLVFINSRSADFSAILKTGDRVGIFPPIGGG